MAVEEVVAVQIGEISGRATYWGKGGENAAGAVWG